MSSLFTSGIIELQEVCTLSYVLFGFSYRSYLMWNSQTDVLFSKPICLCYKNIGWILSKRLPFMLM